MTEVDRACVEATIGARIDLQEARLEQFDLAWRQELPITTVRDGATAFVIGEEFAEQLAAGEIGEGVLSGLSVEISRFVVEHALERSRQRVAGSWQRRIGLRVTASLTTLGAVAALGWMVLRSIGWPKLREQSASTVIALHAEAANRTKHVRRALQGRSAEDTQVLFVGQTHVASDKARAMLAEQGWMHGFALAWDGWTALRSIPRALRIGAQASAAMRAAGYRPGFAQQVAIKLRVHLGCASAVRWRSANRGADTVVFGHTGRADTSLLERAMQAGGATTVHWMHGLTTGKNFQGISDISVTQTEHDARWHDAICHYRRNHAFPLAQPEFRLGERPGLTVLTNFTHPAYPPFARLGPRHELDLIALVTELLPALELEPEQVTWKPHPVFYQADPDTRALVSGHLDRAGFRLWPAEDTDFSAAADCRHLLVTPSGVALDVLKLGRMPVMAELQAIDPAHALAAFGRRAGTAAELAAEFARAADPVRAEADFEAVWQAIGPGRQPDLADIVELARS